MKQEEHEAVSHGARHRVLTPRFLLRDFEQGDRAAFLAYHADPRYLALYGPEEADPGHAQDLFDSFRLWARERPRRNYQLAILLLQEPQPLVGCCGLRGVGRETAELGIELAPAYWARYGYAIEIAHALLGFGFGDLGLPEIRGFTAGANVRVSRLASWFGAVAVATRPGPAWMQARGWCEAEWRVTREAWERRAGLGWRQRRGRAPGWRSLEALD